MAREPRSGREEVAMRYAKMFKVSKAESRKRVRNVMAALKEEVVAGNDVEIGGLFTLKHTTHNSKRYKDLVTGEYGIMPPIKTVKATISSRLKKAVQGDE